MEKNTYNSNQLISNNANVNQIEPINFEEMISKTKQILNIEYKKIRKQGLYNFKNDGKLNLIVDARTTDLEYKGSLIGSISLKKLLTSKIKPTGESSCRLILIIDNNVDIAKSDNHKDLRYYIRNNDFISKIYVITHDDYEIFLKQYGFYLVDETLEMEDNFLLKLQTQFPINLIDGILYVGNYLNARNRFQMEMLNIKTVISLMEPDDKLSSFFENIHFFPVDEKNHEEIDFNGIITTYSEDVVENSKFPVLVFCFSGQSLSVAVCIALLMKFKKWNLQLATAFAMKILPDFNLPSWVFTQVQKLKLINI